MERLWDLARALPARGVPLSSLPALDQVRWFDRRGGDPSPTCKAVAAHARMIYEADLSHPVILSAGGDVMDGMHRIAKAWLLGLGEVQAVQFAHDPEPDRIIPNEPQGRVSLIKRIMAAWRRRSHGTV